MIRVVLFQYTNLLLIDNLEVSKPIILGAGGEEELLNSEWISRLEGVEAVVQLLFLVGEGALATLSHLELVGGLEDVDFAYLF